MLNPPKDTAHILDDWEITWKQGTCSPEGNEARAKVSQLGVKVLTVICEHIYLSITNNIQNMVLANL